MSYRELSMIDVKELLRRWVAGQSVRKIARETGADRGTVGRYVAVAEHMGLTRERTPNDDEVHEVAQCVQSRPLPAASREWQAVAVHKERIESWLTANRPLRLSKVHTLLTRDHGVQVSYDTLRRFAMQQLGWHKKPSTMRIDDPPPGQEAQVDFGKMGPMHDPVADRVRVLWVFIITLSFSRYQFVWPTFEQTTEAVCEGLDRAWVSSAT
jgi:transposase